MNKILIASFDIGKKNFAFVIEEIYVDELKKLKPPKYKSRYTITGEPSTEFEWPGWGGTGAAATTSPTRNTKTHQYTPLPPEGAKARSSRNTHEEIATHHLPR